MWSPLPTAEAADVQADARAVHVCEVGPRDGLQNEPRVLKPEMRAALVRRLACTGVCRIEAVSFVNDAKVPSMAGAEQVIAAAGDLGPNVRRAGLVLNARGYTRLAAAGLEEVHVAFGVTDAFNRRNQGAAAEESLEAARAIVRDARREGRRVTVTLAVAFGCPDDGDVDPGRVLAFGEALAEAGPDELVLADTIGVAAPGQVRALAERALGLGVPIGLHLHNTRNTGYANAYAGLEAGVRSFDAAVGGIGGCPFVPGATGNVATDDLVYALHRDGLQTGIDLDALTDVSRWLAGVLGRDLPGKVHRAGPAAPARPGKREGADGSAPVERFAPTKAPAPVAPVRRSGPAAGASSRGPLVGLRVFELGSLIAGPLAGRILADLGADVIKLEAPGRPDPLREWGQQRHEGRALWWPVQSRGKRLVTLDLRQPAGRDLLLRLVEHADAVVENFRPGTLERWGLAPERLRERSPGLVVTRVSGFGQTGPYAGRAGFASVAEAMGGLRHLNGYPDQPPPRTGLSLGDSVAALYAAVGTLAGLHARGASRDGAGQNVDVSLLESVMALLEGVIPEYVATGAVRGPSGTALTGLAPSNIYRTADDRWIVIAANQDVLFARLCGVMGSPDLVEDPRFATHVERGRHQEEIDAIVAEWARRHPADELDRRLNEAGVVCGPIHTVADLVADPHVRARGALVTQEDPELGALTAPGIVPRFERTPGGVRWSARWEAGADNAAVYGELLGLDSSALRDLHGAGIV